MENKTILLIKIALVRDEESGILSDMVVEMSKENAALVLREQEKCELCREGGTLSTLICSYAKLIGYTGAYFIKASPLVINKEASENEDN